MFYTNIRSPVNFVLTTHDVVHTYTLPVALGVLGVVGDSGTATQIALSGSRTSVSAAAVVPVEVEDHGSRRDREPFERRSLKGSRSIIGSLLSSRRESTP